MALLSPPSAAAVLIGLAGGASIFRDLLLALLLALLRLAGVNL